MKSKDEKGKRFYKINKDKSWEEIFSKTNIDDRKQCLECLQYYQKISMHEQEQEKEKLNTFIADYKLYTQELDQYEAQSHKQHLYQKYRKAKDRKLKAPHIVEPEKKNNLKIYTRNRSSSGSRSQNNMNRTRLFDCLIKLCPRFGRARGSNKRFNPRKQKSGSKLQKGNKPDKSVSKNHLKSKQIQKQKTINFIPSFDAHQQQYFDQNSEDILN